MCHTCRDMAQTQVGSHLPSLPAITSDCKQPIQDLLEQPIPSHLQVTQVSTPAKPAVQDILQDIACSSGRESTFKVQ